MPTRSATSSGRASTRRCRGVEAVSRVALGGGGGRVRRGPSSDEPGAGAGEREPGLRALSGVGDPSGGPSSDPRPAWGWGRRRAVVAWGERGGVAGQRGSAGARGGRRVRRALLVVGSRGGGDVHSPRTRGYLGSGTVASPRLSVLVFAAETGGAARWLAAEGVCGPVMPWGFDVDHEAFAEVMEPFGAVVRVGRLATGLG